MASNNKTINKISSLNSINVSSKNEENEENFPSFFRHKRYPFDPFVTERKDRRKKRFDEWGTRPAGLSSRLTELTAHPSLLFASFRLPYGLTINGNSWPPV